MTQSIGISKKFTVIQLTVFSGGRRGKPETGVFDRINSCNGCEATARLSIYRIEGKDSRVTYLDRGKD
jgi:hypothetical protein